MGVVVSAPVRTRTLSLACRDPEAALFVTVTVMAPGDVETIAYHMAACPWAPPVSALVRMLTAVNVKPPEFAIVGAVGLAVAELPCHDARITEPEGGVKEPVASVRVALLV
jgi:hypothetical protein